MLPPVIAVLIAVLIKKTGKTLPPSDILAVSPEYKGVPFEVLGEGGYFRNPYTWDWKIFPVVDMRLVETLNPKMEVKVIYAGEGTLWTDLQSGPFPLGGKK